jgi:hypothetical protein
MLRMFIKHKSVTTLYTLTGDTSIALAGRDYVSSYVAEGVCIHSLEDINNWEHVTAESCYCMVVVVQQCGLFWLTSVI